MTFQFEKEKLQEQKTNKGLPGVRGRSRILLLRGNKRDFERQGTAPYPNYGGYQMIVFHLSKLPNSTCHPLNMNFIAFTSIISS